jgi:O-antigen ligase
MQMDEAKSIRVCVDAHARHSARADDSATADGQLRGSVLGAMNLALFLWIAMFVSMLIWAVASDDPPPPMGNNRNYLRMALVLLSGTLAAYVLLRDPKNWRRAFPGPLLLLLFYGVLAMVSSSFVPEYAYYALWKSMEIVIVVLVVAAILSYPMEIGQIRIPYQLFVGINTLLVLAFAVEALLMPDRALHPARGYLGFQMMGVVPVVQENALAFMSAVTAFAMLCNVCRPGTWIRRSMCAAMGAIALVVLTLAQSRTSFIGFLLASFVYLLFDRRFGLLAGLVLAVLIGGFSASLFEVASQYLLRGQDAELVTSLSGRTQGWEGSWIAFQEAPFFGHGFAAYARAEILGVEGHTSLHGAIFEVMVGTGGVGVLAWAGAIFWTFARLYFLPRYSAEWFAIPVNRSIRAEMIAIALMILVRASTSSGLAEHEDNFMLFLSVLVYVVSLERALRSGQIEGRKNAVAA